MFQKKLTLQYVIPLHNEEDCLLELYGRLKKIQDISRNTLHIEFIFVNDGSRDNTLVLLRQLSLSNVDVKVISLSRNFGHQIALSAGLNYANADYVLIMDGDLQDPPELMFEMLRMAEEGADIVYGQRLERAGETIFKKVTA